MVSTREVVALRNGHLEVDLLGHGEPVVVIQTALTAEEMLPLAQALAQSGYRVIHYRRRGYAGSSPILGTQTIPAQAADCRELMSALGLESAHVVGASYSAAIALAVASTYPDQVQTVTLIEPPPVRSARTEEFFDLTARLIESYRTEGDAVALDRFMQVLLGRDWREASERDLPGSVADMERDAPTFFESDLPTLLAWDFDQAQAAAIRCPVLYVAGSATDPWFVDAQQRVPELLPQTQLRFVQGAGHLVATTHLARTADLVLEFLATHRLPVAR